MMNSANVGHVFSLLEGSDNFSLRACGVCKVSSFNVVENASRAELIDDSSRGRREVYDVHKNSKNCRHSFT